MYNTDLLKSDLQREVKIKYLIQLARQIAQSFEARQEVLTYNCHEDKRRLGKTVERVWTTAVHGGC